MDGFDVWGGSARGRRARIRRLSREWIGRVDKLTTLLVWQRGRGKGLTPF